jgi:hypothetical protein
MVNPYKDKSVTSEMSFLGHFIYLARVSVAQDRTKTIHKFPALGMLKE